MTNHVETQSLGLAAKRDVNTLELCSLLDHSKKQSLFGSFLQECSGCLQRILDGVYFCTEDGFWHEKCLLCCVCGSNLASAVSCYSKYGKIYCKHDYYQEFSGPKNKCSNCFCVIHPHEMVMRAKDNAYHIDCFVCAICSKLFKTGDHVAFHDHKIYCSSHLPTTPNVPEVTNPETEKEFKEPSMPEHADGRSLEVTEDGQDSMAKFKQNCDVVKPFMPSSPSNSLTSQEHHLEMGTPLMMNHQNPNMMSQESLQQQMYHPGAPPLHAGLCSTPSPLNPMTTLSRAPPTLMQNSPVSMAPAHFHSFDFLKMLPPPSSGMSGSGKGRPRKKKHIEEQLIAAYSTHGLLDAEGGIASTLFGLDPHRHHHHLAGFGHGQLMSSEASARSKRMRTSFKHHQLQAMKQYFNANHNPDAKDLKSLAQKTGLTKRVLQVWFQNARAKFRRNLMREQNQDPNSGPHSEKSTEDPLGDSCEERIRRAGSEGGNDSNLGEFDESFSDTVDFEDDESLMSYSPGSSTESGGGVNGADNIGDEEEAE